MKKEDFEASITGSGITHYLHKENGVKRQQILQDRMSGKITQDEFEKEQRKMRGGKYLKYIFTEREYSEAIKQERD